MTMFPSLIFGCIPCICPIMYESDGLDSGVYKHNNGDDTLIFTSATDARKFSPWDPKEGTVFEHLCC